MDERMRRSHTMDGEMKENGATKENDRVGE